MQLLTYLIRTFEFSQINFIPFSLPFDTIFNFQLQLIVWFDENLIKF